MKNLRETQKQKVLKFLQLGNKLTPVVAMREMGLIGSTLAYHIHTLRSEGWDIKTKYKTSSYSGSRYAEYSLSTNWRLLSEAERRAEALEQKGRPLHIRQLRIGDRVILSGGIQGRVTSLNESNILLVRTEDGQEELVPLIDVMRKLRA